MEPRIKVRILGWETEERMARMGEESQYVRGALAVLESSAVQEDGGECSHWRFLHSAPVGTVVGVNPDGSVEVRIGPETPETLGPAEMITRECDAIKAMLLEKNRAYGNSALDPVRVFSLASPEEQILVRLDDKLSRLQRGEAAGEDVVLDLIGYLVLLRIARKS